MRGLSRSRILLQSALRPTRSLPRQPLRHGTYARSFHYQPNPAPYYQKPKSKIVRDMLLGSALTFTAYVAYAFWRTRKLMKQAENTEENFKHVYDKFAPQFAEAREAKDHERLRELTFGFVRDILARHEVESFEVGPLPPFPEDDELSGQEKIPVEDTLMFVEKDDEQVIVVLQVAVNLDLADIDAEWNGDSDALVADTTKLGELLTRVEHQVDFWRRQNKVGGGQLFVVFSLRDKFWTFAYNYDPWTSVGITTFDE